ncbi:MAG TPA: hypothetical protein DEF47_20810 [Herpetosiphon sp.]|uniref:Uncharacterized protein n=1 Tax=Herpetosiphon aurantiacus (strain ATCC 23779 / DSM 785 / 114-95) TaxID=316274 RepID=A9B6V1_HERA2|nr:hypothetical protein [Herpetosiphon sp.]ABX04410.1 hypothetical protein Haur_1767 [Herpetosiphon aurantiacus DSM 785]HBW52336.1 hypothetical protein [Herpetosiphon sp.]
MEDRSVELSAADLIDELFHVLRDVATASQGMHYVLYCSLNTNPLSPDQEAIFSLLNSYDRKLAAYAAFVDQWRRAQIAAKNKLD